jgi:hypothetical protein
MRSILVTADGASTPVDRSSTPRGTAQERQLEIADGDTD